MDHRRGICKAAALWVLGLCTYLILPDAYAQNANSSEDVIEAKTTKVKELQGMVTDKEAQKVAVLAAQLKRAQDEATTALAGGEEGARPPPPESAIARRIRPMPSSMHDTIAATF